VINKIYIDNYKCFTNFEGHFGAMQLLLGDNGTGKSSTFEVLEKIHDFLIHGSPSSTVFLDSTLTAWDLRNIQSFELGMSGNGGEYLYKLVIEHDRPGHRNRIKSEDLLFNGLPLYKFDGSDAHLFHDDHSPGPFFAYDWTRSLITTIPKRHDNQKLSWFRDHMEQIFVFYPDPMRMTGQSDSETDHPDRCLHQLSSWLRHLWQQQADFGASLLSKLRDIIDGLVNISLERTSESSRDLQFEFQFGEPSTKAPVHTFRLKFDQLSDGQRNLVALYTILLSPAIHKNALVCLDEPDNFISLREIQPWLIALRDKVQEHSGQCLIISHHPELINYLATDCGLAYFRDESGPTRIKPFDGTSEGLITPAELVARGWK
jgi:predicted ATPase